MKSTILNTPKLQEYKKQKRRAFGRKAFLWCFLFVVLIVGLTFASRIEKINIDSDNIHVAGNQIIDSKAITAITHNTLTGTYFWLFPKTDYFIYPERAIKKNLQNMFKRITDVNLSVDNMKILTVTVSEKKGEYIWCGDVPVVTSLEQKCYFADDTGYLFDTAPFFSDGVYFKLYGKVGVSNENPIGKYFLPTYFTKLVTFKETLEKMHLKIYSFWVEPSGDMDIFLSSGAKILFKSDADYSTLAEHVQSALATEPLHTQFLKKYDSLLYIDLRFGNKVYYKFQ